MAGRAGDLSYAYARLLCEHSYGTSTMIIFP